MRWSPWPTACKRSGRNVPISALLAITHYQRLLDHLKPDVVHVSVDGRIVASGGPELALQLEADGYESFR